MYTCYCLVFLRRHEAEHLMSCGALNNIFIVINGSHKANRASAKPQFCVAGWEGRAPRCLRHKTTVLCRKQGGTPPLPKNVI